MKRIQDDGIELEEDDFLQIDFDETSTSYNSSGTNTQASTPGNFQFKEQFIHVANNDQQIMNSGAIASKPINSTIKRNSRASKSSNKNFFDGNSCDGFNAASKDSSFSVENDAITDSEERSRRDSENSRTSCDTSAKQKNDDFKRDSAAVPKHSKN